LVEGWDSDLVDRPETGKKWDARHSGAEGLGNPAKVLIENIHLLPLSGKALDLACGRGVNALILAQAGLEVAAWDQSAVAIQRLNQAADASGFRIDAEIRDVVRQPPPADSYDVILVAHFLDRTLTRALIDALREGGLLFYQTFTRSSVGGNGPSDPAMRLADGELLELFRPFLPRVYREELMIGDLSQGWRDMAMLVAQKPVMA